MSAHVLPAVDPQSDAILAGRLRSALSPSNVPPRLIEVGHWLSCRCLLGFGSERAVLTIEHGVPDMGAIGAPLTSWDFAIRGSARGWTCFWQSPPPPGWHDLFALAKRGEFQIEGQLHPFMANLQFFKDLLALPRASVAT